MGAKQGHDSSLQKRNFSQLIFKENWEPLKIGKGSFFPTSQLHFYWFLFGIWNTFYGLYIISQNFKIFKIYDLVLAAVKKWKQTVSQAFRFHIYYVISKFYSLNRSNVDRTKIRIIFPFLVLPKHLSCYNPGPIKPWMETCIHTADATRTFTIHTEILSTICIFPRTHALSILHSLEAFLHSQSNPQLFDLQQILLSTT